MWRTYFPPFFAIICILFFFITAAQSVWDKSATWDEATHILCGLAQLQTGDPRLDPDHPPLARMFAALPAFFMHLPSVAEIGAEGWRLADNSKVTDAYFGVINGHVLWFSRLTILTLAILLGWLIYAWSTQLFGPQRAWLPLLLYAFCPPLLANAPLVTTDMAATTFMFGSCYAWWRHLQAPSFRRLLWVCLSVAAAFTSKNTAILLVPLFLLLALITAVTSTVLNFDFGRRIRLVGGSLLAIGVVVIVAIDVAFFFDGVMLTPAEYLARSQGLAPYFHEGSHQLSLFWPEWLPVPLPFYYVSGLLWLITRAAQHGHATYFLGQAGYGGWPNYFLMLLLIKLPIPSLIAIGLGGSRAFFRFPRDWWNLLFLILPPLLLLWTASNGKMQIGIRHILPTIPFLLLLAGYALGNHFRRWQWGSIGALAVLSGVSCLSVHPFYLMYFNFLAGGPEQGWRISITGDDYGQGGADLQRWLQARGINQIAYAPFGWGAVTLGQAGIGVTAPPCEDTGELVAINAGRLLITPNNNYYDQCYAWMRRREPDEKIGYSIFIYNSKNLLKINDIQKSQQYLNEGVESYNAGKYQESLAANLKALQFNPNDATAYNNICSASNQLEKWNEAIEACTKAIELEPNHSLAKNNLVFAKQMAAVKSKKKSTF